MDKPSFEQECYRQLVNLFTQTKANNTDTLAKGRAEGFLFAGQFMGLISANEGQAIIEKAHMDVFGVTVAERKDKKAKLRKAIEEGDDAYFDMPAILRK
ncbi:hypothetical protein C2869_19540 [Saccharobesus litoralis]|uniref:Uncharacterized protein n=1 Tax=Saccharobesus litoralis TaxID=2172099 RepID=A0A2S0VW74_9ALTE|nr:hypothetical protein [Saccharobesus litoralis]AWB68461.1 hypothetical protein C2869_19540 [Saccharobesus litoralis]